MSYSGDEKLEILCRLFEYLTYQVATLIFA